jgi:hypothetical protein
VATPGPETRLVAKLLARLRRDGWAIKVHGSEFSAAGEPDITACVRGRLVMVEAKVPGKRPEAKQFAALRRWQAAGALAGWVTSVADLELLLTHVDDAAWVNPALEDVLERIAV